jgi:cob(I)alamin adenosyltransferase
MQEQLGKVHVITGPGKGKTSAAFGLAMRAAGHGLRVHIIQLMKTGETSGEVLSARKLEGIRVEQFGTGRFVDPKGITQADKKAASDALERAQAVIEKGECEMLVLDEVNLAVSFGLLSAAEVLRLLRDRRKGIEVVLTGRNAPIEFIEYADYVSIVESKKHPFDQGLEARKGIEW